MDPAGIQAMFRFNTWANDSVREGLTAANEGKLRQPLDTWYGTVFSILTHILGGETIWLARLRDGEATPRVPTVDSFPSAAALAEAWRAKDEEWEQYAGSLSDKGLASDFTARRRDGTTSTYKLWQPVMQIAFHGTEHRGHATVAMTQLGIKHGPQDFLDQFRAKA
jgi:uncharacterized damage-inducible protein DinB